MSNQSSTASAICSLYEQYAQDIYRFAWYSVGNRAQAEDIVQEVFLRAFRSWDTFRHQSNAKTWLMSIARRYLYDTYRKKRLERKFVHTSEPPDITDEQACVNTMLEVQEALSKIKSHYSRVIILRYIQQLSVRETSQVLGWSEAKVRMTTQRAVEKLRALLSS